MLQERAPGEEEPAHVLNQRHKLPKERVSETQDARVPWVPCLCSFPPQNHSATHESLSQSLYSPQSPDLTWWFPELKVQKGLR